MQLKKLSKIRKEKNITMKEISSKLNISESHYCLIENGKRKISYILAIKISRILNLKPDDIFYDDLKNI